MTRWEYTAAHPDTGMLARLREQGWELVAVVYDIHRLITIAYFKRPLKESSS